ncbi:MAG: alpha/beta fold hydrolase [Acidimicrobiales bacterium]
MREGTMIDNGGALGDGVSSARMSHFVLVHGSWHGSWVWDRVAPLLAEDGHRVVAPDLPGRGDDPRPPSSITLDDHVARVLESVDEAPSPAILVGHSFGGFVISHVAEAVPERVGLLVYLAAFLLRRGESVFSVATSVPPVVPHLEVREQEGLVAILPHAAREVFYNDCSAEDAASSAARLVPEALAPRRTPASVTEARFGRIPRVYVETTRDRGLQPVLQKRMHAGSPCREVASLWSGHSPFLSMPERLAALLRGWGR